MQPHIDEHIFLNAPSLARDVIIVSLISIPGDVIDEVAAVWAVEDEPVLCQVHHSILLNWVRLYPHQLCGIMIAELHSPLMLDEGGLAVHTNGTGIELLVDILVITHTIAAFLPIVRSLFRGHRYWPG